MRKSRWRARRPPQRTLEGLRGSNFPSLWPSRTLVRQPIELQGGERCPLGSMWVASAHTNGADEPAGGSSCVRAARAPHAVRAGFVGWAFRQSKRLTLSLGGKDRSQNIQEARKRTFLRFGGTLTAAHGTARAPLADCCTHAHPQSAGISEFNSAKLMAAHKSATQRVERHH